MEAYKRSVSTRWTYTQVKIEPAARPGTSRVRAKRVAEGFSRDWRRRHTLQVTYRGGSEAWWCVSDGVRTVRIPGHLCFHDAMRIVAGDLDLGF